MGLFSLVFMKGDRLCIWWIEKRLKVQEQIEKIERLK